MDVHLRDLRYFVAVADELSFTRAAERLHLSQPALSKQIAALETTLRARLLRRDRRQVSLTAAGAALHAAARRLLADWDEAAAVVADTAAAETKVLRVGTLTSLGRALFPAALEHFAKRQPGWRVELRSFRFGDPTAGLSDRASDAAFVSLPTGADDIGYEVLATERRFVALSTGHPLAGRQAVEFSELADEPFAAPLPLFGTPASVRVAAASVNDGLASVIVARTVPMLTVPTSSVAADALTSTALRTCCIRFVLIEAS